MRKYLVKTVFYDVSLKLCQTILERMSTDLKVDASMKSKYLETTRDRVVKILSDLEIEKWQWNKKHTGVLGKLFSRITYGFSEIWNLVKSIFS